MNRSPLQRHNLTVVTCALLVLTALFAPAAGAQLVSSETTVFTTDKPLRVGETILDPGTYDIQLLENSPVLVVMDHGTNRIVARAQTVLHQRDKFEVTKAPVFMYYPTAPGIPQTLRTWFAPHVTFGRDIIYPASVEQEIRLALVRSARESQEQMAQVKESESTGTVASVESGPSASEPEPVPMVAEARPVPSRELPLTASRTPLFAALGALALAGAALLRKMF